MTTSVEAGVVGTGGSAALDIGRGDRSAGAASCARRDAHAGEWVAAGLLASAAELLPVIGECPPLTVDVHTCLCIAAVVAGVSDGGAGVHRLADVAETLLTEHLVRCGLAKADTPGGTLRGWLLDQPPSRVARELRRAARFNRLCLLADELGCDGLSALLLAQVRGAAQ